MFHWEKISFKLKKSLWNFPTQKLKVSRHLGSSLLWSYYNYKTRKRENIASISMSIQQHSYKLIWALSYIVWVEDTIWIRFINIIIIIIVLNLFQYVFCILQKNTFQTWRKWGMFFTPSSSSWLRSRPSRVRHTDCKWFLYFDFRTVWLCAVTNNILLPLLGALEVIYAQLGETATIKPPEIDDYKKHYVYWQLEDRPYDVDALVWRNPWGRWGTFSGEQCIELLTDIIKLIKVFLTGTAI